MSSSGGQACRRPSTANNPNTHNRPGSAFERSTPPLAPTPESFLQRCASAGATRPRSAGSSRQCNLGKNSSTNGLSSVQLARNSSAPAVRQMNDSSKAPVALDIIPVRARVQYGTYEFGEKQLESPTPAVDAVLQTWRNALWQLHTGYFQLVAAGKPSVDATRAADFEPTLPIKHSRPATARTHSSSPLNHHPQTHPTSVPGQRPATATSHSMRHTTDSATCDPSISPGSCTIPDTTDAGSLALMFVALTASLFQWAITPPTHDPSGSSRTGTPQRPSTSPVKPRSSSQQVTESQTSSVPAAVSPSTDVSTLTPAVQTLLVAGRQLQKSCGAASQVGSLKQEVEALHHDNTLLRNALARAQQESAEYISCMSSMHEDSAAVAGTQRQHAARVKAELEEMKRLNGKLQSELNSCSPQVAQAHSRHQEQKQLCEELNRRVNNEKQTSAATQQRAIDAETLVTTLHSRVGILQAELDESRTVAAPASTACAHAQTDASLLEPLTVEARSRAENLEQELRDSVAQQHRSEAESLETQKQLQQQAASLTTDSSRLQAEVQSLTSHLAEKDLAASDAQSDCARTTTALKKTQQDLRLFRDRQSALQSAMHRMEAEVAEAREVASEATVNCEDMKASLQAQFEKVTGCESRVIEEQQVARASQDRVRALQEQLTEVQQKAQASEERASDACSTALAAQEQVVSLQHALQDAEKNAQDSHASAEEAEKSAAAAIADLNALRQLHAELGLLHGDHACGRVTGEDLADLKRELQSLQRVRRRLETSARGLRAAQVLQDSNVLQIRVDGGAGALADSRAESTRSRQQLREMRARLQEVQCVAQRQAFEVAALREKLPEGCVAEVTRAAAAEVLSQGSKHNTVPEDNPVHTSSSLDNSPSPYVVHAATPKSCLDHHTLSRCQDDEHCLNGESFPVNVEPCHSDSVSRNQQECRQHEELPGRLRDQKAAATDTADMRWVQHPETDVERHCEAAPSQAADRESSEVVVRSSQTAGATAACSQSVALSHITSRGTPQSLRNLNPSTKTNQRPPSCTKTTITTNPFFTEKSRQPTAAWLTQAAPLLPPPAPGDLQEGWKRPSSPLLVVSPAQRPSTASGVVPIVVRRSSVGGAANLRSAMDPTQQYSQNGSLSGLFVRPSSRQRHFSRFTHQSASSTNSRSTRSTLASATGPSRQLWTSNRTAQQFRPGTA